MKIQSFSSNFKSRMEHKGNSRYERNMNKKQRTFQKWFENSLTRHDIVLGEETYPAVVQDQNQANNKGLSDDKYLIVENTTPTRVGSIIKWLEDEWIVFSNEYKTIQTHKQQIIKMCNHKIKWVKEDGSVSGEGNGHTAYVQNNTLYTLGVSMSGNNAWITNAKMSMYMQNNEETKNIPIGQRVFIGDNVFEIMMKDFVSRDGLIYYLMEQNFYNAETDDFENRVADMWKAQDSEEGIASDIENNKENDVVQDDLTLSLLGSNTVKIGKTITIHAELVNSNGDKTENPIQSWIINEDLDGMYQIVEQGLDKVTIKIVENFKFVGKQITFIGTTSDGLTSTKTINITSPY